MERNEHTPKADNFKVGAKDEFHELAEDALEKNTGATFELVSRAFGLGDCSEVETREAWKELEDRGFRPSEIPGSRSPEGPSVGQIMDQLDRQNKE